jgi:four helix bundle protein
MPVQFDHERLKVYQEALRFVAWAGPVIDELPAKLAARDQLDRASTSIPLNLAEGNGKRTHPDRCRYFDIARGSGVECAACLDVLTVRGRLTAEKAAEGKAILLEVVAMTAGLIARFSPGATSGMVGEDAAPYLAAELSDEKEKD